MIQQEYDVVTGTLSVQIKLTDAELRAMTRDQAEMLADAGMLLKHALRGDVAPVYLRSLSCMSHGPALDQEQGDSGP